MSALQDEKSEEANVDTISPKCESQRTSPVRRRRRVTKWQRGQLSSWKRKRVERPINGDMHVKVIIIFYRDSDWNEAYYILHNTSPMKSFQNII